MPLTVTASLSRKTSRDFQSSGTSITLSAEVDGSLISKPDELQREISRVFDQARVALDAQAENPPPAVPQASSHRTTSRSPRGATRENGNGHGSGERSNPATESQLRAIAAIARRLGVDKHQEIRDEFGVEISQLDVRTASAAIDFLKTIQSPAGDRNGGRR